MDESDDASWIDYTTLGSPWEVQYDPRREIYRHRPRSIVSEYDGPWRAGPPPEGRSDG